MDEEEQIVFTEPERTTFNERYKASHDEINMNVRTIDTIQYVSAVMFGTGYTWLLQNRGTVKGYLLFLIPAALVFCAAKAVDLSIRVTQLGAFLIDLEKHMNTSFPGWETYKRGPKRTYIRYDAIMATLTTVIWSLFVGFSFYISWRLYKNG